MPWQACTLWPRLQSIGHQAQARASSANRPLPTTLGRVVAPQACRSSRTATCSQLSPRSPPYHPHQPAEGGVHVCGMKLWMLLLQTIRASAGEWGGGAGGGTARGAYRSGGIPACACRVGGARGRTGQHAGAKWRPPRCRLASRHPSRRNLGAHSRGGGGGERRSSATHAAPPPHLEVAAT